jgi:lipopolysaccharide transport system ATP-binding protein
MSSEDVVLRLRGVGKDYRIFDHPLQRVKHALLGGTAAGYRVFTALKNVDLTLHRGETVGIVGANGAGKSTLLQIVCGILRADRGEIEVAGRVSALLELGASFNPQFTGRENVRINGMLMGLTARQVVEKMDEILAFADIGDFIDQPVRTYSSGMFARLGFAVAINLDPDILIIDEALAVGDEAFQRKCFSKIEKLKAQGVTILFVSHSARAVVELCDRAVLMYKGESIQTADAKTIVTQYQRLIYASPTEHQSVLESIRKGAFSGSRQKRRVTAQHAESAKAGATCDDYDESFNAGLVPSSTERYAERGASIDSIRIETLEGRQVNVLRPFTKYLYRYRVTFQEEAENVRFAMTISATRGVGLGAQWTAIRGEGLPHVAPGTVVEVCLPFHNVFTAGSYFVNAGVQGDVYGRPVTMHRIIDAVMFRVSARSRTRTDYYVDITSEDPTLSVIAPTAEAKVSHS